MHCLWRHSNPSKVITYSSIASETITKQSTKNALSPSSTSSVHHRGNNINAPGNVRVSIAVILPILSKPPIQKSNSSKASTAAATVPLLSSSPPQKGTGTTTTTPRSDVDMLVNNSSAPNTSISKTTDDNSETPIQKSN